MTDSAPGAAWKDVDNQRAAAVADLTPSEPAPAADALPPLPPNPAEDAKPKRPTTRAGRRAITEAKKAQGRTDAKPKGAKAPPRRASLETRLAGSLTTVGTMVAAAGAVTSPAVGADGIAIITHAPAIAAALDKVAKDDPRVAASLEQMLTAGVWSGLVAAMLPLVLTIAANHGAIPPHLAALLGAPEAPPAPEPAPAGSVPVV